MARGFNLSEVPGCVDPVSVGSASATGAIGGAGGVIALGRLSKAVGQITITGSISSLTVALETSFNGTNWVASGGTSSITSGSDILMATKVGYYARLNITTYTGSGSVAGMVGAVPA